MSRLILLIILPCVISCNRDLDVNDSLSGQELYTINCQRCHGVEASGSAVAKFALDKRVQNLPDSEFLSTVLYGKPRTLMKGFEGRLRKEDIEKIRKYLNQLKK